MIDPHVFGPLTVNATTLAVTNIGLELTSDADLEKLQHSANRFDSVIAKVRGSPAITFMTPIKAALDLFGVDGLRVTTLSAWMVKFADFRISATASDDTRIFFNANAHAFGYIESVSASQGGLAMASCRVELMTGTATTPDPWQIGTGAAPSLGTEPVLHTIGPVQINGTVVEGIVDSTVSFGHVFSRMPSDGQVVAATGALLRSAPQHGATVNNPPAWLASAGVAGAIIGTSYSIWFRAFAAGTQLLDGNGLRLASAANSGRYMVSGANGSSGANATASISASFISATDTNPLTYTASAVVP